MLGILRDDRVIWDGERVLNMRLLKGDIVSIRSGGGGWGSSLERDPKLVQWNVVNRYVTIQQAKEIYGVVINPETLEVDLKATERLRKEMRERGC